MKNNDFYTELYINCLPERAWESFLLPNSFFKQLFGTEIHSTFELGSSIEFASEKNDQKIVHIYGKILECEKYKVLCYTDHPGSHYHKDHAIQESRVRITFEKFGQSTKMTLTNDRFTENNPMIKETYQWWYILSNLKTYIECGKLIQS